MANYNNNQNGGDLASWIVTVIFLMTPLWPVGLIMLLRKVLGLGRKSQQKRHPYDLQREAQTAPAPRASAPAGRHRLPGSRSGAGRASRSIWTRARG